MKVTTVKVTPDLKDINSPEELKRIIREREAEVVRYQKRTRRQKWAIKTLLVLLFILLTGIGWLIAFKFAEAWWMKNLVVSASPTARLVKMAKATELVEMKTKPVVKPTPVVKATIKLPTECERYREIVEKYFGSLTDEALFTASKESGCDADRTSNGNRNGTRDYCLFRINSEPATAKDLDTCVRRAFEKYQDGRVGIENWSAFYAVCDVNAKPVYPNVIKNCS